MTARRKKILFVLYVMLIGAALLYLLFPSDSVKNALVNRMQRDVPNLRVSIGDLKPAFPPALSLKNVAFSDSGRVLFSADRITLKPGWISLFTSQRSVNYRAIAYQGKLSGVLSLAQHPENGRFSINGVFSDLQLEQIPMLREKLDFGLIGRVSGRFHFDDVSAGHTLGDGQFFVTDCTVTPPEPILEIDRLSFQRIDLAFTVDGNKVELRESAFQGPLLNATLSGSIAFEVPTERSVLDLDINVTPQRQFLSTLNDTVPSALVSSVLSERDNFNLKVTGSMGTPRAAFGAAR